MHFPLLIESGSNVAKNENFLEARKFNAKFEIRKSNKNKNFALQNKRLCKLKKVRP